MITPVYDTCKREIAQNGTDNQLTVACEECAELIQAITKIKRYGNKPELINHLAEEVCDVEIMITQLKIIFPEIINQVIDWKFDKNIRMCERLEENKK